jgi:GDP-4-dehydro-6-deoxy-D-mannose reductase
MTVLITGASGFSGRAMIRFLAALGEEEVRGLVRKPPPDTDRDGTRAYIRCDLLDQQRVMEVLDNLRPDRIVHLAALNRGTLGDLISTNAIGTRNLLEAVRLTGLQSPVLVVSSSAVYGYAGRAMVNEDTTLCPWTDYGVSKTAQEYIALMEHVIYGMQVAVARPFNLVGPGQPDSLVCGRIVQQVVEIERRNREVLNLLEVASSRDYIDVRDAVRAYWALVSHPDFERMCSGRAFNIGSGTAYAVSDVIAFIEELTHRTYVVEMPEDQPVVQVPFQQSDISRIREITGWQPEISLKESLSDMLEAARKVH